MKTVGVYEARTHWARILREVEDGEIYIITRRGKPVARIVPTDYPLAESSQGASG
jgi:prevent-host-death family protein